MTLLIEARAVVTVFHGPDDGSDEWMRLVLDVANQLHEMEANG